MLALALACLATPSPARDDAPPEADRLVRVFGADLHLRCQGTGSPTVMLEAGLGGNYLDWTLVQPTLARHMRACAYDRAGAGRSGRTARPRSAANMAEDLHELVGAAGIATPFVLVGHSLGGLLSLFYARRYPADVLALVLLDPMHPDQFDRFAAAGVSLDLDPHSVLGHTPLAAATYGLPPELHAEAMELAGSDSARVFVVREMTMMVANARAVRDAGYPRLPARILIHGRAEWDAAYPDGRMERVWRGLQADLAVAIGAPPPIVAVGSGHQIALDAPDAVVAAVRDVVGEAAR